MEKYVVTIGRQFGSMGRPIARELSEILGIDFYDRDIVEAAAEKIGMPLSKISDEEENASGFYFFMKYPLGKSTTDIQDKIFNIQRRIIVDLADRESCIIVGRCSDSIMADHKNHISIFIYAPYEERLKNCVNELHMTPDEARKLLPDVDKARDLYHMRYAKYLPSDYRHMDIMINSSILGVEGTANALAGMIQKRFG